MRHPVVAIDHEETYSIHSLTLRTTEAGASTSNSTAPSLYFRE